MILVYLLVANLATFAGTSGFANAIPYIGLVIILAGLAWGFILKSVNPEGYRNIGHMVHEGDAADDGDTPSLIWSGCDPVSGRPSSSPAAPRASARASRGSSPRRARKVAILARHADQAKAAAAEIGDGAFGLAADVTDEAGLAERATAGRGRTLGGIDVLCANAGIFPAGAGSRR